jgi:NAD(P)H-dependent FMN reductase
MRVLGISGSLRRDSYNTTLLRHAGDLFEADGELTVNAVTP